MRCSPVKRGRAHAASGDVAERDCCLYETQLSQIGGPVGPLVKRPPQVALASTSPVLAAPRPPEGP